MPDKKAYMCVVVGFLAVVFKLQVVCVKTMLGMLLFIEEYTYMQHRGLRNEKQHQM